MTTPGTSHARERKFAAIAALVGVNIVGVSGQAMWAYASLGHAWPLALGFAAVLESVALYLTSQASAAMLANDRTGSLRLAAYAFGILTGAMNYAAHCGPHYSPTALAIAFGILSALSPWLWAIQSRRTHRDELSRSGLIDPRTVHIPGALWMLYPGRAFGLLRLGVSQGINHLPTLRKMIAERNTLGALAPVDQVMYAFGAVGFDQHTARVWLAERGVTVDQATLDTATAGRPRSPMPASMPVSPAPAGLIESPTETHRRMLDSMPRKREKIAYAYRVNGHYGQAEARAFLSTFGITAAPSEYGEVIKKETGALTADSGSYPTVPAPARILTPVNGYAHPVE